MSNPPFSKKNNIMKKIFSAFLPMLSLLLFASCGKESEPCKGIEDSPYNIMQRIILVELDEWGNHGGKWGISDIDNKKIELIAMTENFTLPMRDRDGKVVKQVAKQVEARPYGGYYSTEGQNNYMELYMASAYEAQDSYFILKIDEGLWFRIKAMYYSDNCKHTKLKGFVFEDKEYTEGTLQKHIPIDEKKKRAELKRDFPDGFPYKL